MRKAEIKPKDRSTPKGIWKALDRALRTNTNTKAYQEAMEQAFKDMCIYGYAEIDHEALTQKIAEEVAARLAKRKSGGGK